MSENACDFVLPQIKYRTILFPIIFNFTGWNDPLSKHFIFTGVWPLKNKDSLPFQQAHGLQQEKTFYRWLSLPPVCLLWSEDGFNLPKDQITYSPKYAAYEKAIRAEQIARAEKMAANGSVKRQQKNPNDPARFVNKVAATKKVSEDKHSVYGLPLFDSFINYSMIEGIILIYNSKCSSRRPPVLIRRMPPISAVLPRWS